MTKFQSNYYLLPNTPVSPISFQPTTKLDSRLEEYKNTYLYRFCINSLRRSSPELLEKGQVTDEGLIVDLVQLLEQHSFAFKFKPQQIQEVNLKLEQSVQCMKRSLALCWW